jgi:hypothetical protein
MKYIKLFESFLNTELIKESTKITLATEIPSEMIKPDVLREIKAALGLDDGDSISEDKIKEAQKNLKIMETGKLDAMTILALLKGPPPAKKSVIENSGAGNSTANETYYLNEAKEKKGIDLVKIVNSQSHKIVNSLNTEIKKMIEEYSPWEQTYTVLGNFDFTTGYRFNIEITNLKATEANFREYSDKWHLGKVAGTVDAIVSGTYIPPGLSKITKTIGTTLGITMSAWIYDLGSKNSTVHIEPPKINLSSGSLDVGVGYLYIRNNNVCFTSRWVGELEYPLPLQDYVNQAFDPEGGSLVRKISDLV